MSRRPASDSIAGTAWTGGIDGTGASERTGRPWASPRGLYRTVAVAEAITWALLLGGMLIKYVLVGGEPGDIAVRVGGFLHGLVFLAYVFTAVLVGLHQRWGARLTALAVGTAVVPFATIPFDRWLERRGLLHGAWRREATDDPRDFAGTDRLLRWALNHPVLLVLGSVLGLAAVMTVLLLIGPPGR
ncbi:DUF3817 domain-containing protein [Planctomonas psychrotolerans]|uniref:DUF3817 domain-containing protein n=1 Tax=Planctomonas psychrotolerans TaxID=2528712 RepID=UPI00123ACEBF|nr:DUF3817 domain-containing protein [Planctomonas psychrotolerans]